MENVAQPTYPEGLTKPVEKLTQWKNEPSVTSLKSDLERAQPFQNAHLRKVSTWLDNLEVKGTAAPPKVGGRSSVQPRLIRKQAEWRYTSLSEPFLNSGRLFTVSPRTHLDTKAARQAQTLLNWQMDTCLNKVTLIDQYVRTAVDEGTVVLQTGWVVETEEQVEDAPEYVYEPLQDGALATKLLQLAQGPEELLQEQDPTTQASVRASIEQGTPVWARVVKTTQVRKTVVTKNYPTVEVANIRNLVVDPSCGADYTKARFMGYTMDMSKSDMEADKRFKNLDAVNWNETSILSQADHTPKGPQDFNFQDKARNLKTVNFYWGLYDVEGDGVLVSILTAWIGEVMVRCEKNPFPDKAPPFVIVPLLPIKGSFYGEPDGELLADNQKILGAITRGVIDLLGRSANAQRGMAKGMLDVVNKRRFDAGQDYEFNGNIHPQNGVVEHKFPEIPVSAMNLIGMLNMESESLTGVKTFSDAGLSGASLGPTAAGARGVLDAASRREMGILRRLAAGLALVGNKIALMNQAFLSKAEVVRVTDEEFVEVDRESLRGNYDLKVDIATADEDEARASRLEFMLQTMGPNSDQEMVNLLLSEVARLRRMPELAHRIENFQPQPNPLQQRKAELEIAELESNIQKNNAQAELAQAQAKFALARADQADLDFVEQETGTKHARDVDKIASQARANTEHSITEAILNQSNGKDADGKESTAPKPEDIRQAIERNA